ncbi:MAG: heavy metal translocating P-type ATPase [bacterium]
MSSGSKGDVCFHCGENAPTGTDLFVEIKGSPRIMCCHGCEAVASAIVENGLEAYYDHRTVTAGTPDELVPAELKELEVYDTPALQSSFVNEHDGSLKEASLILEGIVCAACVWVSERHVTQLPGVVSFSVNYATHRAQLVWDDSVIHLSDILVAISAIGYHAHPFDPRRQEEIHKKERSIAIRRLGVAGVGAMQVMMLAIAMYLGEYQGMSDSIRGLMRWASLVITVPVLLYSAQTFFKSAWRDLSQRRLGMDVPVSIAIIGGFSASVWATVTGQGEVYFDSVTMFTFLLLLGRFLELNARHRAGQVADELVKLIPSTAHRKVGDEFELVPVAELRVGDAVLIKPGESIPADGVVLEGASSIDESLLTGESYPQTRTAGDGLIGGTVNMESPVLMRVNKLGAETVLASISRLLERAQQEKPKVAELANRVAAWFVAALLVVAGAVFTYWYLHRPEDAFWITLSVLVVTCPCALSLATPVAMTAVTGTLTSLGVLITRGTALETFAQATDVIFDKTGTLSKGHLSVVDVKVGRESCTVADARAIAAGLELYSEHPLAQALREGVTPVSCAEVEVVTGKGVTGRCDGRAYRLGSAVFTNQVPDNRNERIASMVYLVDEEGVVATFYLEDELRAEARACVEGLKAQGMQTHLLSGDVEPVVNDVAQSLGIDRWRAGQMPEDKLGYVKALEAEGRVVVMVGDGVNDAPVLAAAHVSVAMGGGAQLAQASADVVLLSENLSHLQVAIEKSRSTLKIIKQNILWAIAYNLLALPLAAAGFVAPWMAAIGMSLSSLIVVLNALRLKGGREGFDESGGRKHARRVLTPETRV